MQYIYTWTIPNPPKKTGPSPDFLGNSTTVVQGLLKFSEHELTRNEGLIDLTTQYNIDGRIDSWLKHYILYKAIYL